MIVTGEQLAEEAAAYMRQRGQAGFARVIDEQRVALSVIAYAAAEARGGREALATRLQTIEDTARKALS